jgi:nucleoid-associated protein YgaU
MGLFDFIKNAGAKILGKDDDGKLGAGRGLSGHLRDHGIDPRGLKFTFDGDTVIVEGRVPDQDTREKAVLIIGNVEGVARVDDRLVVGATPVASAALPSAVPAGGSQSLARGSAAESSGWTSRTYTVEKGDTLSGIAKKMYGSPNKYPAIFEANRPMLKDPDRIYPGQVLRIPPLAA